MFIVKPRCLMFATQLEVVFNAYNPSKEGNKNEKYIVSNFVSGNFQN